MRQKDRTVAVVVGPVVAVEVWAVRSSYQTNRSDSLVVVVLPVVVLSVVVLPAGASL